MEGYCLTGQSPQWAVLPMEEVEHWCPQMSSKYEASASTSNSVRTGFMYLDLHS